MSEMAGIERAIHAFDLHAPDRILLPGFKPLRRLDQRMLGPRYTPGPQPEGTVRVHLSDDYYLGPLWDDYRPQDTYLPEDVFDIPAPQRERWDEVREAYLAMQEEISMLMRERRETSQREPPPAMRQYYPQP